MKGRTKAAVSIGLLALLFWVLPWAQLEEAFRRLSLRVWLGLLAGFIAGHLLGVVKWRTVVNAGRAKLGFRDAVMCYGAGLFTNLCLPTIVGGDILRLTMASKITRNPAAVALGGVTDRLSDILALGILLALGLLLSTDQLPGLWGQVITVVVVVGGGTGDGWAPVRVATPAQVVAAQVAASHRAVAGGAAPFVEDPPRRWRRRSRSRWRSRGASSC